MKLELVKETSLTNDVWYAIYLDGKYIKGSSDVLQMSDLYYRIHETNNVEPIKEILHSSEIVVSSEHTKTQ